MTPSAHPLRLELEGILLAPDRTERKPLRRLVEPRFDFVDDIDIAARILRALASGAKTLGVIAATILRTEKETSTALVGLRAKGKVALVAPAALDPSTSRWGLP